MKKTTAILTAVILLLAIFPVFAAAATDEMYTVDSTCKIVVGAQCSETDRYAADTLSKYIAECCGTVVPVITDEKQPEKFEIAVGKTNRFSYEFSSLIDGSYVVKSTENGIAIYGLGNRGTIYGVYNFLERYCGLRIFTSQLRQLTKAEKLEIPVSLDYSYDAFFEYTDTDWLSPRDVEYSLANGLSGGVYRKIPEQQGGTVSYIGQFCHTLSTVFCSSDKYFAEHPEYFALHDGKRTGDQLCLTNEATYNIVLAETLELIKANHNPDAAVQIVSLTQHDNRNFCECESCKAIDDANGSHAGTMITFVNRIAQAVKDAGYNNIAIDTFAYQYTRTTPTKVVPLDNVIVRLCTIECCFSHSLDDPSCEENVSLMSDLTAWSKICNRLYIWDYTTNYARTLGIFPDFGVLQKNIQIFFENSVKGIYEEGNYYMGSCDTEFGELRAYLLSRLMQNPYCNYSDEMNTFLEAYYGAGWQNIRNILDIYTENASQQHLFIYDSMKETIPSISDVHIEQCDTYWENAKNECKDETQLANINRSQISWRFWKACNFKSEFSSIASRFSENKTLYNDIAASGATKYSESRGLPAESKMLALANPDKWDDKLSGFGVVVEYMLEPSAITLYAAACAVLLAVFILAIIRKKYIFLIPLPLTAAIIEVVLWNRRAFLAWKDLDEFFITLLMLSVYFGGMFIFARKAKADKPGKKQLLISFITGALVYVVPHEAILLIVNNLINKGNYNNGALIIALTVESIVLTVVAVIIAVRLKNLKKAGKTE